MYQHNRFTSETNIFQKVRNLDFILVLCILLLGVISLVILDLPVPSVPGGQLTHDAGAGGAGVALAPC